MDADTKVDASAEEAEAALKAIHRFLMNAAPHAFSGKVDAHTRLLSSGALDSLGILQLTMFLADEMKIEVTDEDFVPENLDTVGSLVQFVLRKRGLAG